MIKKGSLWFADWDDETGRRRRKGFISKRSAIRHQHRMRTETASKKARASEHSANSQRRGPSATGHRHARRSSKRANTGKR
jgi:hypothetical protein